MKRFKEYIKEKYESNNITTENPLYDEIKNEVIDYFNSCLLKDKKEYRGDIKTKFNPGSAWNDESWIIDELIQFINRNYSSSYIYKKFSKKYDFALLNIILKNEFPKEYTIAYA